MSVKRNRFFLLVVMALLFGLGFFFGYFIQGSAFLATQSEISSVRENLNSLELEQLLLLQAPERSCPVISSTATQTAQTLYDNYVTLRQTSPSDPRFDEIKQEVEALSIKSWILSNTIEDKCNEGITTILFAYSQDCSECEEQDAILQDLKNDSNDTVLVYAVDLNSKARIVETVKNAYDLNSAPKLIIKGSVYDYLTRQEVNAVIKEAP